MLLLVMSYFDVAFLYSPYYIMCPYIMCPHYIRLKCVLNKVIDLTAGSTYFPWNSYLCQYGWSFSYKLPEFICHTWLSSRCISNLKILSFKITQPFDFLLYVYLIWKLCILKIQINRSYIKLIQSLLLLTADTNVSDSFVVIFLNLLVHGMHSTVKLFLQEAPS